MCIGRAFRLGNAQFTDPSKPLLLVDFNASNSVLWASVRLWQSRSSTCRDVLSKHSFHFVIYVFQYEDFEVLSQTAREVWLAEQCSAFETQIQTLSREREKDHFLEELYRKLKQVTRRWQSWNHRSFGGVTSRGCVCSCCTFTLNFHRIELFMYACRTKNTVL